MSDAPRLPPAYRLVALERVGSTNEEARRRAEQGAADGTLIWAQEQTAGRGRRGRRWDSPRGNLYFSLVLRPESEPAHAAQLGMVAAVAVADVLADMVPPSAPVALKWPNDVLAGGRKLGGILLESAAGAAGRLDWLVLGIGINIASAPAATEFPATCLRAVSDAPVETAQVLEGFARAFLDGRRIWRAEGFAPIRQAWLSRAWRRGEPIQARLEGRSIGGVFADLDEEGALLLELADGAQRRITAADVFALPPSP